MAPKRGKGRGRGAIPKKTTDYYPPGRSDQSSGRDNDSSSGPRTSHEHAEEKPNITERSSYPECSSHLQLEPTSSTTVKKETSVSSSEVKQELALIPSLPKRLTHGTKGRPIRVISNLFPIEFPGGYVYHYDIEVIERDRTKPDDTDKKYKCKQTKIKRKVISLMLDNDPKFEGVLGAYDGQKNLYTKIELRGIFPIKSVIHLPDECPGDPNDPRGPKEKVFDVYVNKTDSHTINLDSIHALFEGRTSSVPREAIMVLETILRHNPCLKYTPIGRSFYYPPHPNSINPLGGGLEVWFGFHQSVLLSQWKATVNIDVAVTTFLEAGPVLNFIESALNMSVNELSDLPMNSYRKRINKIIQKLYLKDVKVTHLKYPRRYTVIGLTQKSASEELVDERQDVTVEQYFRNQYKKVLQYPYLPCLHVKPEKRKVYLPIEICEIVPGQHSKAELNRVQKTKMIKFSSKPPRERFERIHDIVKKLDLKNDRLLQHFGVKVSNDPLKADGRVIDAPILAYSGREIEPKNGSWDLRSTHFFQGASTPPWIVLSFGRTPNVDKLCDLFFSVGKNLGMKIHQKYQSKILPYRDIRSDKVKLLSEVKKQGFGLAIIVIPELDEEEEINDKILYAEIKKAAETMVGLATQCIKEATLRKVNFQVVNNLCLKINAKLGGENNSMARFPKILAEPVIIIGADVNHPPPTQLNEPSLAACVGSLDSFCKRVAVCVRAQENANKNKRKVEIIQEIEIMVRELLVAFYRHTRHKPRKIIFYRDGVSEGEIAHVKNHEIAGIRKACLSLEKGYEPGITCILVQKRHHVRFMPQNPRDGAGRMQNVPPGTVIDNEVTHPTNFDFYLCSQFGLQGTSRPSHYTVVEDDNDFSADDLQELTYQLCHMCVRCTKSISIPAPVAYADLAAYRARKYLEAESSTSSQHSREFQLTPRIVNAIQIVKEFQNSMYFV